MFILPDIFTPFIKGRETAIAANWNDRNNYNKVYNDILRNMLFKDTYDDQVRNSRTDAESNALELLFKQQNHPTRLGQQEANLGQTLAQTRGIDANTDAQNIRNDFLPTALGLENEKAQLGVDLGRGTFDADVRRPYLDNDRQEALRNAQIIENMFAVPRNNQQLAMGDLEYQGAVRQDTLQKALFPQTVRNAAAASDADYFNSMFNRAVSEARLPLVGPSVQTQFNQEQLGYNKDKEAWENEQAMRELLKEKGQEALDTFRQLGIVRGANNQEALRQNMQALETAYEKQFQDRHLDANLSVPLKALYMAGDPQDFGRLLLQALDSGVNKDQIRLALAGRGKYQEALQKELENRIPGYAAYKGRNKKDVLEQKFGVQPPSREDVVKLLDLLEFGRDAQGRRRKARLSDTTLFGKGDNLRAFNAQLAKLGVGTPEDLAAYYEQQTQELFKDLGITPELFKQYGLGGWAGLI